MKDLLLLLLFAGVLLIYGCSEETPYEHETGAEEIPAEIQDLPRLMMQPGNDFLLIPSGHITEEHSTPEHLDRESARSFIFVQPNDSLSSIRAYERGRILELSLDVDLTISARINRNQAVGERIRNLSATILEPYEGVLTLSVEENQMTGNIDLVSENRLFHLRYDSLSGMHYLAEIDRSRLDVQEGSGPLEF